MLLVDESLLVVFVGVVSCGVFGDEVLTGAFDTLFAVSLEPIVPVVGGAVNMVVAEPVVLLLPASANTRTGYKPTNSNRVTPDSIFTFRCLSIVGNWLFCIDPVLPLFFSDIEPAQSGAVRRARYHLA